MTTATNPDGMRPRTIVDKIWADHVVVQDPGAPAVLAIDLHLIHEVTSPQAGIQCPNLLAILWIPAFAGMTSLFV